VVEAAVIFYLGTHQAGWLATAGVPLFVSRRRLARRPLRRAAAPWALDSGAFTELSTHGRWDVSAADYAAEVRRWSEAPGGLRWAAVQDWMCEPAVLARTGLSVAEHQRRTVDSYLELRTLAPDLPWLPVLQGWVHGDYLRHLGAYARAGVDLAALPLVGLGSVCRRQETGMAEGLIRDLHGMGLRLHGFGFKLGGLRRAGRYLASADSMAWSFGARRSAPLPGCRHRNCAHCLRYALWWRGKALRAGAGSDRAEQLLLFGGPP
jgi:hypothetical protein